jgi:type IV conjugative transfer system coupling protein TraD
MGGLTNIIRGGQVQIHQFRMAKQILGIAAMISLLVGALVFALNYNKDRTEFDYCAVEAYSKSWLMVRILPAKILATSKVNLCNKGISERPNFYLKNKYITEKADFYYSKLSDYIIYSLIISLCSFLLIVLLWMRLGNMKVIKDKDSGVYTTDELYRYLKYKNMQSQFSLGNLPLVKNKETAHMLFTGASGTGKSNAIKSLIKQVRANNQNAIIVDLTGDYVDLFYDLKKDYILNPTDPRSVYWDLWKEMDSKEDLSIVSNALFAGENQTSDKFWSESAKTVFEAAVVAIGQSAKGDKYKALYELLAIADLKALFLKLNNSAAASLINPQNDKTAFSIRSTVVTYVKWLEYLKTDTTEKQSFSIKNWMNSIDHLENGSVVFLTASSNQRKILEPLLRMWMDIALAHLMNLPISHDRRVWFIMDEMPALGKLPSLSTMVAESRKYGGCIVGGIQSISQLYDIYGHHGANITIDGFATKIFFRVTGIDNTAKIARIFGMQEKEEIGENITYGSHEMRDGVSISKHQRNKLIVTEKDIASLQDLEAYVLLPCELNIVKVKFELFKK